MTDVVQISRSDWVVVEARGPAIDVVEIAEQGLPGPPGPPGDPGAPGPRGLPGITVAALPPDDPQINDLWLDIS